jgi:hypothetical protein
MSAPLWAQNKKVDRWKKGWCRLRCSSFARLALEGRGLSVESQYTRARRAYTRTLNCTLTRLRPRAVSSTRTRGGGGMAVAARGGQPCCCSLVDDAAFCARDRRARRTATIASVHTAPAAATGGAAATAASIVVVLGWGDARGSCRRLAGCVATTEWCVYGGVMGSKGSIVGVRVFLSPFWIGAPRERASAEARSADAAPSTFARDSGGGGGGGQKPPPPPSLN